MSTPAEISSNSPTISLFSPRVPAPLQRHALSFLHFADLGSVIWTSRAAAALVQSYSAIIRDVKLLLPENKSEAEPMRAAWKLFVENARSLREFRLNIQIDWQTPNANFAGADEALLRLWRSNPVLEIIELDDLAMIPDATALYQTLSTCKQLRVFKPLLRQGARFVDVPRQLAMTCFATLEYLCLGASSAGDAVSKTLSTCSRLTQLSIPAFADSLPLLERLPRLTTLELVNVNAECAQLLSQVLPKLELLESLAVCLIAETNCNWRLPGATCLDLRVKRDFFTVDESKLSLPHCGRTCATEVLD